jgi:hypothetical protein
MVAPRLKKWAEAREAGRWVCRGAGMDGFPIDPVDPAELRSNTGRAVA